MRKHFVAVALVGVGVMALWACTDQGIIPSCYGIPDGGCPVQGGVECMDPTCAAAYTCGVDGGWVFSHVCPPLDASVQDTSIDVPTPNDAGYDIDAPPGAFGGPGCNALEPPDCPLGQALLCTNGCCGCSDLYVCDDGGWNPWGACADDAGITKL